MFIVKLFKITVVVWFIHVISVFYGLHLSFLTIGGIGPQSIYLQILAGLLIVDFLSWLHHMLRHKIQFFWHFHALHHSQKEMNMFTDFRVHFMDMLMAAPIITIPLLILDLDPPQITLTILIKTFLPKLYHANIKTNLGILRYILVTPQSHRIHHSIEPNHINHNYGVIFSIWDHLFRTQYRDYDVYPDTGIEDNGFPLNENDKKFPSFLMIAKQLVYPLSSYWRSLHITKNYQ